VNLGNTRGQQPRPAALNASHNGPCPFFIKDHYIFYLESRTLRDGRTLNALTEPYSEGRQIHRFGLLTCGPSKTKGDMGLHVSSGPTPNSYPLKSLASCVENGGRILLYFENEPSFVGTWDTVSLLASLHVFTSRPRLFLEVICSDACKYASRKILPYLLRKESLAVIVTPSAFLQRLTLHLSLSTRHFPFGYNAEEIFEIF
jgi:hypothetical protein